MWVYVTGFIVSLLIVGLVVDWRRRASTGGIWSPREARHELKSLRDTSEFESRGTRGMGGWGAPPPTG